MNRVVRCGLWGVGMYAALALTGYAEDKQFSNFNQAIVAFTNRASSASLRNAAQAYMEDVLSTPPHPPVVFGPRLTSYLDLMARQNRADKGIEFLQQLSQTSLEPDVAYIVFSSLSDQVYSRQSYDQAVKVRGQLLEKYRSSLTAPQVSSLVRYITLVQTNKLAQPRAALDLFNQELSLIASNDVTQQAEWLYQTAQIHGNYLKDPVKANEIYQKLIQMGDRVPSGYLSEAYLRLAQFRQDAGNSKEAVALVLDCIKNTGLASQSLAVQKLIDYGASSADLDAAVVMLRKKIVPEDPKMVYLDLFQADVIKLLLKNGQRLEALKEARIWVYGCSVLFLPSALDQVAYVLKQTDGNLGRANAFLKYQKFGPAGEDKKTGTADDLADILKTVGPINDPVRQARCEKIMAGLGDDWTGYQARAQYYICMDRPEEAFNAVKKAFELCPLNEKLLQASADQLARLVVVTTRDLPASEKIVEYLLYGQAGHDGREGTADDLKDPSAGILAQIRYAPPKTETIAVQ